MKRIFLIITLILTFIGQINTYKAYDTTDNFHLDQKIQGVYLTRYNNNYSRNGAIYIIKDSNNNIVYCIEPFQPNLDNSTYQGYLNYNSIFNLTLDQIEKINLYAYYGYGYNDRLDSKWYIITQALIWRETGLSTHFTEVYQGDKVDMYNLEMNELIKDVEQHYVKPSINNNYEMGVNEQLIIEDTNNVLKYYDIEENIDLNIKKEENRLIIDSIKNGEFKVKLVRRDKVKTNDKILFYNDNSQNVIYPGKFSNQEFDINIKVYSGSIRIYVNGEDENIVGAKYNLYDYNNELIDTYISDESGCIYLENLNLNKYYIKQVESIAGYEIDNTLYEITLTMEELEKELNLKNKKIVIVDADLENQEIIFDVPNTLSNSFSIVSLISYLLIIIGLGIVIFYAKKD